MNLEEKEISENVQRGGFTVKLRLRYPFAAEETKRAKRINAFLERVFESVKEKALSDVRYSFHSCVCRVYSADNGYLSVFFELSSKGKDRAFSYSPFSFTFDENGSAVPLFQKFPKKKYSAVRAEFMKYGIRLSKKEFLYSYYLTPEGAKIYASRRRGSGRNGYIKYEYAVGTEPEQCAHF